MQRSGKGIGQHVGTPAIEQPFLRSESIPEVSRGLFEELLCEILDLTLHVFGWERLVFESHRVSDSFYALSGELPDSSEQGLFQAAPGHERVDQFAIQRVCRLSKRVQSDRAARFASFELGQA